MPLLRSIIYVEDASKLELGDNMRKLLADEAAKLRTSLSV